MRKTVAALSTLLAVAACACTTNNFTIVEGKAGDTCREDTDCEANTEACSGTLCEQGTCTRVIVPDCEEPTEAAPEAGHHTTVEFPGRRIPSPTIHPVTPVAEPAATTATHAVGTADAPAPNPELIVSLLGAGAGLAVSNGHIAFVEAQDEYAAHTYGGNVIALHVDDRQLRMVGTGAGPIVSERGQIIWSDIDVDQRCTNVRLVGQPIAGNCDTPVEERTLPQFFYGDFVGDTAVFQMEQNSGSDPWGADLFTVNFAPGAQVHRYGFGIGDDTLWPRIRGEEVGFLKWSMFYDYDGNPVYDHFAVIRPVQGGAEMDLSRQQLGVGDSGIGSFDFNDRYIAVASAHGRHSEIRLLSRQTLAQISPTYSGVFPTFNRDGSILMWRGGDGGFQYLDLQQSWTVSPLYSDAWSPVVDGRNIYYFSHDIDGYVGLYRHRIDG